MFVLVACSGGEEDGGGGGSSGGGGGGGVAPAPNFTASQTTANTSTPINFTDASVGGPTAWQWDFDNDTVIDSTAQHPTHTYTVAGVYSVSLTVSNNDGANTLTRQNYITIGGGPTANFSGTPTSVNTSTPVNFSDTSTGSPTSWQWDFDNDGSTDSTALNPSRTYTSPGVYSVKLTVSNAGGSDIMTRTNYITVSAPPVADFTGSPTITNTTTPVSFTDMSTGGPTSWAWDFNNDTVVDSTQQNPTHTYTAAGQYSVTLTVSNTIGSDGFTRTNYITVNAPGTGVADLDADTDRDGNVTAADETGEDTWNASGGAVYYFNQDDDEPNNSEDYLDTSSTGNDPLDLARVMVRQYINPPAGGSVVVGVSTAAQSRVRLFRLSGASTWTQVYSSGANFTLPLTDIAAGDITLGIEARDRMSASWDGKVTLTLEVRNSSGTPVGTDSVILRVAPPLMATNLWTVTEYNLVNVGNGTFGNPGLRNPMASICSTAGITYREVPGNSYNNDRWLQDSSEFAVIQLPSSSGPRRVIPHVMQLARWRECDDWCEDVLFAPDYDFFRRFSTNTNSHNYGGNVEIVPPYAGKPYGRVMTGGGNGTLIGTSTSVSSHMVQVYKDFWNASAIQTEFEITSEWLAVGHVDEFTAFIPAPATSRGWVVLIASPDRAYQVLQATQSAGHGSATVFAGRTLNLPQYGISPYQTTVDNILNDTALATLNNQVQARIDSARTQIKTATGLTDADFIELPTLFENVGSNYMAAYNPGVVNMVTMPAANGTIYFAIPDPEGPDIGGVDQWQQDILNQMNALDTGSNPFDITFVDVFYSYHALLGEAHCGSNFTRTPPNDDWWNK
jgi:PKD repeat protein